MPERLTLHGAFSVSKDGPVFLHEKHTSVNGHSDIQKWSIGDTPSDLCEQFRPATHGLEQRFPPVPSLFIQAKTNQSQWPGSAQ